MGKLSGKAAVMTGGNSGIGLATAAEFAREGGVARAAFMPGRGVGETGNVRRN